jgi:PIN domain nuclease of toxin-antitoxin system
MGRPGGSRPVPIGRSVNGYLLDTNVALLATFHSISLSAEVRGALESGPNYVSVVAYWEVVLKSMKGALKVGDPRTLVA